MSCRWSKKSPGLSRRVLVPAALASTLGLSGASNAAAQETTEEPSAPEPVVTEQPPPEARSSDSEALEPRVAEPPPTPPVTVQVVLPPPAAASETVEATAKSEETPAEEEGNSWTDAVTVSGYVEAYYSHNFNKPENNTTAARWLDEQTGQFTLQTVVLDVAAQKGPFSGQVTLMFGPTADRWYFEGAAIKAGEDDVLLPENAWSNETWKHLQNAWVAYEAPIGNGLTIQGGLFPTQVGYEPAAAKDNGNFSRSNLFTWLPFFHVGLRAVYPLTDKLTLTGAVYNGYNQLRDLNDKKTMGLHAVYAEDTWFLSAHYLGGVERPDGDVAGDPWRNLFDVMGEYSGFKNLTLAAHLNTGFEKGDVGDHKWLGGALYARLKLYDWLYLALRGDGLKEMGDGAVDAPIFFGKGYLMSGTATAEFRPIGDGFSIRLEYRHDESDRDNPMFYTKGLTADGSQRLAATQNTLTLGLIGWF